MRLNDNAFRDLCKGRGEKEWESELKEETRFCGGTGTMGDHVDLGLRSLTS